MCVRRKAAVAEVTNDQPSITKSGTRSFKAKMRMTFIYNNDVRINNCEKNMKLRLSNNSSSNGNNGNGVDDNDPFIEDEEKMYLTLL